MLSIKKKKKNTDTFSPLHSYTLPLCCKRNVNVFQALRYISAISGTVLSTTMVRREQWSRDQCSISWISEGDILCKFISHCEQASQLVNGTVCTTALFTRSQSTHLFPLHPSPVSPPLPCSLFQLSSQPTVALVAIKDAHKLICVDYIHTWSDTYTQQNLWSPRFWGHYSTPASNPFSDFYLFIPSHYTDPFIPITHAAPHQTPWSSDT